MTKKLKQFTVDRKLWYRGNGPADSYLLNSNTGKMCCVGFLCLAAGLTKEEIADRSVIGENKDLPDLPHVPESIQFMMDDGVPFEEIYMINDLTSITNKEREERLERLFAKNGWEVTFSD